LQSRLHLTSYVDDGGRQGFGGEGFETQRHRGTERGEVGERTEERGEVGERTEERGKVGERTEERGAGERVFVLARADARASMISDGQRTLVTKFYEEPRYWESVLVIGVMNPYK
jgi:hypothetical protein